MLQCCDSECFRKKKYLNVLFVTQVILSVIKSILDLGFVRKKMLIMRNITRSEQIVTWNWTNSKWLYQIWSYNSEKNQIIWLIGFSLFECCIIMVELWKLKKVRIKYLMKQYESCSKSNKVRAVCNRSHIYTPNQNEITVASFDVSDWGS